MDFFIKVYKNNFMNKYFLKMKKYIKFILIILFVNQAFSQVDEVKINLLRAKNQTIEINKEHKLNILIYPELSRNGEYRIFDKKNRIKYVEAYNNVDFIIIDFERIRKKLPKGTYIVKFISEAENPEDSEVEKITIKLK
jgi:hypothetical protein